MFHLPSTQWVIEWLTGGDELERAISSFFQAWVQDCCCPFPIFKFCDATPRRSSSQSSSSHLQSLWDQPPPDHSHHCPFPRQPIKLSFKPWFWGNPWAGDVRKKDFVYLSGSYDSTQFASCRLLSIPTTLKLYFRGGRGYPPKIQKTYSFCILTPPPSWMY